MKPRTILPILFALLTLAAARPALAEEPAPPVGDKDFKPVTTHIEADCWSVLKIEKPAPTKPSKHAIEASAEEKMTATSVNLVAWVSQDYRDSQGRPRAGHFGVVEFPSHFSFDRHGYNNWYLFSLYDEVALRKYADASDRVGQPSFHGAAVLDLPLAKGFGYRADAPDRVSWEALELPLCTTLAHEADRDKDVWKFLNVPLVWGWRYERRGKETNVHVLDVPAAALYTEHARDGEHDNWKLLDLPCVTLASGDRTKEHGEFKLVDIDCLVNVCLWRQKWAADSSRLDFLRLPILGSLFSVRHDKTGTHAGIFRGLFSND